MTVGELKNLLESFDDETEVRFASQPNWPFEYEIEDAVLADLNYTGEQSLEEYYKEEREDYVVYLVEGRQLRYLPSLAKEVIGW